jgi:hypothetical protein
MNVSALLGADANLASIHSQTWLNGGVHAGALFNNRFAVGGFFNLSLTDIPTADYNNRGTHADTRMGGLFAEYRFMPEKLIHFTTPLLLGIGEIQRDFINDDTYDTYFGESNFWFIEPGVMAELNVTSNFLLQAGVTYRAVIMDSDYFEFTQSNMSGLNGRVALRVNIFNK